MKPLFDLGRIVATPDALAMMGQLNIDVGSLLHRHVTGDWGNMSADDKRMNTEAITNGARIFSSYIFRNAEGAQTGKLWVITTARGDDGTRESTCILTPDEY
jgi:hypothetical protein